MLAQGLNGELFIRQKLMYMRWHQSVGQDWDNSGPDTDRPASRREAEKNTDQVYLLDNKGMPGFGRQNFCYNIALMLIFQNALFEESTIAKDDEVLIILWTGLVEAAPCDGLLPKVKKC